MEIWQNPGPIGDANEISPPVGRKPKRIELKALAAGKAVATKRQRAQILLAPAEDHPGEALKDEDIACAFDVSDCTAERTRCALAEHGLADAGRDAG